MRISDWSSDVCSSDLGPLHGVRVLEMGSFIAGPFAGQLLGDYGADVIKVESPGDGDPMRRWGVTRNGDSLWWPAIARNKRSITLDLRDEGGRDVVRRLAAKCDIVLENFRPGTLEKWGLDYATLAKDNPRLVMTHISGFGQTGPLAGQAGFGSVGEAMGGIRHRSEEHTSELQSLMRISYAVFCLKKKKTTNHTTCKHYLNEKDKINKRLKQSFCDLYTTNDHHFSKSICTTINCHINLHIIILHRINYKRTHMTSKANSHQI